jgi:hypothetical protein
MASEQEEKEQTLNLAVALLKQTLAYVVLEKHLKRNIPQIAPVIDKWLEAARKDIADQDDLDAVLRATLVAATKDASKDYDSILQTFLRKWNPLLDQKHLN